MDLSWSDFQKQAQGAQQQMSDQLKQVGIVQIGGKYYQTAAGSQAITAGQQAAAAEAAAPYTGQTAAATAGKAQSDAQIAKDSAALKDKQVATGLTEGDISTLTKNTDQANAIFKSLVDNSNKVNTESNPILASVYGYFKGKIGKRSDVYGNYQQAQSDATPLVKDILNVARGASTSVQDISNAYVPQFDDSKEQAQNKLQNLAKIMTQAYTTAGIPIPKNIQDYLAKQSGGGSSSSGTSNQLKVGGYTVEVQ